MQGREYILLKVSHIAETSLSRCLELLVGILFENVRQNLAEPTTKERVYVFATLDENESDAFTQLMNGTLI